MPSALDLFLFFATFTGSTQFPQVPVTVDTLPRAVELARNDAKSLPVTIRQYVHYLWMASLSPADRERAYLTLAGHVNHLSREADLIAPVAILDDGTARQWPGIAAGEYPRITLLRLNREDYGWKKSTFEKLNKQAFQFYVTLQQETERLVEKEFDQFDENNKYLRTVKRQVKEKVKGQAIAPWIAEGKEQQAAIKELIELTQTQTPILDAMNFFWQTSIQFKREVGYYGLLDVKNRGDFFKLVGFDEKLSKAFSQELRAAVSDSGVAHQPRRISRYEKQGGGLWSTFDNELAVDKNNPIRVLDDNFKHLAEEHFAHLANGLWGVFLNDKDGNRQDSAPDFIGPDTTSPRPQDGKIHIYRSCFSCHVQGGLQPVDDWVRSLVTPPLQLSSADYQQAKILRQQYLRRIDPFLKVDRDRYEAALKDACGLTAKEWTANVRWLWSEADSYVDSARAARELGVSEEMFLKALARYVQATGQANTVLGMFLRPAATRKTIPRDTWHEEIPNAHLAIRGYVQQEQQGRQERQTFPHSYGGRRREELWRKHATSAMSFVLN